MRKWEVSSGGTNNGEESGGRKVNITFVINSRREDVGIRFILENFGTLE